MLRQISGRFRHLGLLIVRIGIGCIYAYVHGFPKLMGGPEGWARYGGAMEHLGVSFLPEVWGFCAAFAECLGGVAVVLGLFFAPATLLLAAAMIVASVMHLSTGDGLSGASHAMKMAFVFVSLFLIGPGKYSIDSVWGSSRRRLYR